MIDHQIVEFEYKVPKVPVITYETKDMLKMCFKRDPSERPTAQNLLKIVRRCNKLEYKRIEPKHIEPRKRIIN